MAYAALKTPKPAPRSATVSSALKSAPESFSMKDTVRVGYWSYVVWDMKWQPALGSDRFHKKADAEFLILNITAVNNDVTSSLIPPFKLVDDSGREHDESSDASAYLAGSLGLLKRVNPNVRVDGYIAFDVPRGSLYKLQVSGGYSSGKHALISLY
jgi:hypothetical protein